MMLLLCCLFLFPNVVLHQCNLLNNKRILFQHNEAEMEPDTPLSPERNPREATNTSSDARPFHVKYSFLPLWEVQVMSDSREDENHDCFALKACSLCAMDGRRGNLLVTYMTLSFFFFVVLTHLLFPL